jgi:hypothetical protein
MALPINGTQKRIVAGVVVSVIMFFAGVTISNMTRITAAEYQIKAIVDLQNRDAIIAETNRRENKADHEKILTEIKDSKK